MTLQRLEKLLNSMEGHWFSQKTTYYINTKRVKTNGIKNYTQFVSNQAFISGDNQVNFSIYLYKRHKKPNSEKIIYKYSITKISRFYIKGIIKKLYDNSNSSKQYTFIFYNNYLKIYLNQNNINYTEHIYFINSRFMISTTRTKLNNKYTAINFCSNIKINNQ